MKKQNTASKLSRAEVSRRIQSLKVDARKNLSGYIAGCRVNAWATGSHRQIERVSVCAIPKQGGNLTAAYRVAKQIKAATGLVVHWHGAMNIGGVL